MQKARELQNRRGGYGQKSEYDVLGDKIMAIREIRTEGDEILSKKCKEVTSFDRKLHILLDDMYETMMKHDGVGLAAPQVGAPVRAVVGSPVGAAAVGPDPGVAAAAGRAAVGSAAARARAGPTG